MSRVFSGHRRAVHVNRTTGNGREYMEELSWKKVNGK